MKNEMIMKVARALSEADGACNGDYQVLAKAAIKAMSEPTKKMIDEGRMNNPVIGGYEDATSAYIAMIEAALEE